MQKNIGIFTTLFARLYMTSFIYLLKLHNIGTGTHLKGIETSFQVSDIAFLNFLKIPSVFKGLIKEK
jgi:hypothetical protein